MKRARIEATDGLVTEAQSGYRYMQRGVSSVSRAIEGMSSRVLSEASGMSSAVDALNVAASATLGNVRRTTQSLVEEGTREDRPTGLTPRKRARKVIGDLAPTESRDTLIRRFRSKGVSSVGSETFLAEHLPLPEGEEAASPVTNAMAVDSPVAAFPSDDENRPEPTPENTPPLVRSLASSSSSATTDSTPIAPSIPTLKPPSKSSLPTVGTLTERSTNVGLRTRTQRTRRTVR